MRLNSLGFIKLSILLLLVIAAADAAAGLGSGFSPQSNRGSVAPIIPGDHPDPTIVRIGATYWTTNTSGDWAPVFVLYRSSDLFHWQPTGSIFPVAPTWAEGSFWAPELVADQGRVLVYYVGRKRGGPLCVAVATAARPEGSFTDHGPIVCEPDGSIDPSFIRDESGKPYLIWKEDGNSIRKPTPIWAQPLTSDLLRLTGGKTQLIVNEPASWEGGVVEGPFIQRHDGRFYLFYAGNACCGVKCNYAEGVARADQLLGPWQKDPANPIIRPNETWKCPGHGTAVEDPQARDYFLYHAYPADGTVYLGRESILDPITWNSDGWPQINSGRGPGDDGVEHRTETARYSFSDDFKESALSPEWRWPVNRPASYHLDRGKLALDASTDGPAFVVREPLGTDYEATVTVSANSSAEGGIGVIGNAQSELVLGVRETRLTLWRIANAGRTVIWHTDIPAKTDVRLRVSSDGLSKASFSYSLDRTHWIAAGPANSADGLPLWDHGFRIGLVADGVAGSKAMFSEFSLIDRSK